MKTPPSLILVAQGDMMPPMTLSTNTTPTGAGNRIAQIVLNIPVDRSFDYTVPEEMRAHIARGKRVKIPFGPRVTTGYCIGTATSSTVRGLKPILRVLDEKPILDADMLELTRWMASYYRCSWGEALDAVLPGGVKRESMAREKMFASLAIPAESIPATAQALRSAGREAQAKILEWMVDTPRTPHVAEITKTVGCSLSPLTSLEKAGKIRLERRRVAPDPFFDQSVERTEPLALNPAQAAVVKQVDELTDAQTFGVVLLHGVTGSGKTEVYLQTIDHVVREGKQAIVLVPEIALTPQAVRRFRERFDNVYVLHSMLSDTQRYAQWQAIRQGLPGVVIGPRSAIFAPVRELGVLVIDEEHESTFKQQSTPRYHARDVGIMRARRQNAVVILGSATPSLESYSNATGGKFALAELPERVEERPMPKMTIVDMQNEFVEQKRQVILSRLLVKEMKTALDCGEQAILFINRRGYSTHVQCRRCGYVLTCEQCAIALTYHRSGEFALCHYCNTAIGVPGACPDCHGPDLRYTGAGTQKVEDVLAQVLSEARVVRMDSDTMRRRDAYEKTFCDFGEGRIDVLIGTQMIAKGLDFPNVTVVGVVAADLALNLPDFRAAERTFQLLAQVGGRTGRGSKEGKVIVQAFNHNHYSITTASRHDYAAFAQTELAQRRTAGYPPYARMARVLVEGKKEDLVMALLESIAAKLKAARSDTVRILGPAPAPVERAEGSYRQHLLIWAATAKQIQNVLGMADGLLKSTASLRVTLDIDPTSLM